MMPLTAAVSGMCLALVLAVFFMGFVAVLVDLVGQREGEKDALCLLPHSTSVWGGHGNGAAGQCETEYLH